MRRIAGLISMAAVLATPGVAAADDRYAEPGGNGSSGDGQCLSSDPCGIQAAVEDPSVADGDRVLLLAGTYALGSNQLLVTDDITVQPASGVPRPTLSSTWDMPGGAVQVDGLAPGAVLRNLLISHGGGSSSPTGVFLSGATGERLYVVSDGFIGCAMTTGTLRDSVCFLTAAAQSSAIGAAGISIGGAVTQTFVLRNVTAISKEPNAPGLVVSAAAGANMTLDGRNVITEGTGYDAFASASAGSTAAIALANSNYASFDATSGASVTSNTTAGNQAAPPLFADFVGNNFRQAAGSPTIDAGAADSLTGSLDVDGNARTLDGRAGCPNAALPDIGAYEAPAVTPSDCPAPGGGPGAQKKCKKKAKKKRKPKSAAAKPKKKKKKCGKKKRKKKR